MTCEWQAYLDLLPFWIRPYANQYREILQEIRMRIGQPIQFILKCKVIQGKNIITQDDILFCINSASKYSPWSAATITNGYLSGQGGHRIGVCGCVSRNTEGKINAFSSCTSLCIRVARSIEGIADQAGQIQGSILILGPPGSGKTTLLRDLIRVKSNSEEGPIAVVDEKEELFPYVNNKSCFEPGKSTDVISCCSKSFGIETLLRNMGPKYIAVDEITAENDCQALIHAGWCGVKLLATAHASSIEDLKMRQVYRPLLNTGLFTNILIMQPDQSWKAERILV